MILFVVQELIELTIDLQYSLIVLLSILVRQKLENLLVEDHHTLN